MPRLSLDINGSKQLNVGPWCFNYSLFRGCASKKLKKHNFPVKITFCRLLQCFYLKLCDLYLKKAQFIPLSSHLLTCRESPRVRAQRGCRAAQHRDSQSRLQDQIQVFSPRTETSWHLWETSSRVWQPSGWKFLPAFKSSVLHFSVSTNFVLPLSVHLISAHPHKEFI